MYELNPFKIFYLNLYSLSRSRVFWKNIDWTLKFLNHTDCQNCWPWSNDLILRSNKISYIFSHFLVMWTCNGRVWPGGVNYFHPLSTMQGNLISMCPLSWLWLRERFNLIFLQVGTMQILEMRDRIIDICH